MAEPLSTTKQPEHAHDDLADRGTGALAKTPAKPKAQAPLQIALRVLIGFGGLALLVGFFLPWLNVPVPAVGDAPATVQAQSGLTLATSEGLVGTPAALLFLVPALGVVLTATAFMGFKWSGQVAVGVAVGLIGYSGYVLLQMFVQHTAVGLWVVSGSVFLILLLGVLAWMTGREPRAKADAKPGADAAADIAGAKR